jgi:hypothetical protein
MPVHRELKAQLSERARLVGEDWASRLREAMRMEMRPACGGWPGTLSEARAHVAFLLVRKLPAAEQARVTEQEREQAARLVYSSARSAWLQNRQPEPDEEAWR